MGERWRCSECGTGEHLMAIAAANASGPLDAVRGELATHDNVEECYVHEDSVECALHIDAAIQRLVDGVWCLWQECEKCAGTGRAYPNARYGPDRNVPCAACKGREGHDVPVLPGHPVAAKGEGPGAL